MQTDSAYILLAIVAALYVLPEVRLMVREVRQGSRPDDAQRLADLERRIAALEAAAKEPR